MKLSVAMHEALSKINAALMQGDEVALERSFDGVDLEQLLSQETIAVARALGKKPMVLLLCTLAEQNGVQPMRAKHWLDCYQSVVRQKLVPSLLVLSPLNVLRLVVESLMEKKVLGFETRSLSKVKGGAQAWQDALELLLDHRDWKSCLSLLEALEQVSGKSQIWVEIAKSLSQRHFLYVDETGLQHIDVDYLTLSKLYSLCAKAAHKAKVPTVGKALSKLEISALEIGGDLKSAIDQIYRLDPQKKSMILQFDLARCFCKQGKLIDSIERLDHALGLMVRSQNSEDKLKEEAILGDRKDVAIKEQNFDLKKASLALSDLTRMAKLNATPVFLVSGTLLGYVREGQLLSHDKDIDVGIVGWENQYNLCMTLQESGLFTISAQHLKGKDTFFIPIKHNATGMWIDVFVYHPQRSHWVTGVDFFFGYRQTFEFTPFELQDIEFLGVTMKAPANAELNLTENYGNWRVPDAAYLSHLESPSTMEKGNLAYMLTARISMLSACLKKQNLKIQKVLSLMRVYQQMPGAMPEDLMIKIETAFLKPVINSKEVCHA
jgi:hypothetical protein